MARRNSPMLSVILSILLIGALHSAAVRAQPIQTEFAYTPVDFATAEQRSSQATKVFLQPSGRIVIYGSHLSDGPFGTAGIAGTALTSTGSFDSTFGDAGGILGFNEKLATIIPLSDGKYVKLAGYFSLSTRLNRYTANGSADSSFTADLGVGSPVTPVTMTLRSDGKLLVLVRGSGGGDSHWLLRLNPDGTRDAAFGTNGLLLLNLGRLSRFVVTGIHSLDDNRILLAGSLQTTPTPGGGNNVAWAALLDEKGFYDRSFGFQGVARVPITAEISLAKTLLQPDGKVVMVGRVLLGASAQVLLVRLTARGRPDSGFGQNGVVILPKISPFGSDAAYSAAAMSDGRLVVVGSSSSASSIGFAKFLVARFSTSGSLESHVLTELTPNQNSYAFDVAIQADGKIVVVGSTRNPLPGANGDLFAVARYTQ